MTQAELLKWEQWGRELPPFRRKALRELLATLTVNEDLYQVLAAISGLESAAIDPYEQISPLTKKENPE